MVITASAAPLHGVEFSGRGFAWSSTTPSRSADTLLLQTRFSVVKDVDDRQWPDSSPAAASFGLLQVLRGAAVLEGLGSLMSAPK